MYNLLMKRQSIFVCATLLFCVLSLAGCVNTQPIPSTIDIAQRPADWFTMRGSLDNCRIRFERDKVGRVVFLGGSITHMRGWRDMTAKMLQERFPDTKFEFIDAGIPSTGSTPGAFRFERDVLSHGRVDLLFEEAAVNDSTNFRTPTEMTRGYEGIIRHARLAQPNMDVITMHFVAPWLMEDYNAGKVPVVVQRHEQVSAYYEVPSINLALEVTQRINAGEFEWKKDFRDLHPSPFGHKLYTSTIGRLLDAAWSQPLTPDAKITPHEYPKRLLDDASYYGGRLVDVREAQLGKGWKVDPSWKPAKKAHTRPGFVDVPMLVSETPGAVMKFKFTGNAVGLFVAAGEDAGIIDWRLDGGEWKQQNLFTQWSNQLHIPWAYVLAANIDDAPGANTMHTLEVRISDQKDDRSTGHACRIVHFLVNRDK